MLKLLLLSLFFTTSIYSFHFNDINGNDISVAGFQGKRILLVNIATASPKASQLGELQQLRQYFGDSVVIIAFPSNSFGNEPKNDMEIKQFCFSNYAATYIIASKNEVSGSTPQPIYDWLAKITENGQMNGVVKADYEKFVIDKNGSLIGAFSSSISPNSILIRDALSGK